MDRLPEENLQIPQNVLTTKLLTDPGLPQSFYDRDAHTVARELLGKTFVKVEGFSGKAQRKSHGDPKATTGSEAGTPLVLAAHIVETEVYHEKNDPSCHAHNGRTLRNAVMFGPPGFLYVYFTYGMHHCMNVVAEREGIAAAVLIRALAPLNIVDEMRERRPKAKHDKDLTNGPAKSCAAFGITTGYHNGVSLFDAEEKSSASDERLGESSRPGFPHSDSGEVSREKLFITSLFSLHISPKDIVTSPRIGISKAQDYEWRYFIRGNKFVSG